MMIIDIIEHNDLIEDSDFLLHFYNMSDLSCCFSKFSKLYKWLKSWQLI